MKARDPRSVFNEAERKMIDQMIDEALDDIYGWGEDNAEDEQLASELAAQRDLCAAECNTEIEYPPYEPEPEDTNMGRMKDMSIISDTYDDETLAATGAIALTTLRDLKSIGHRLRNLAEDQTDHNLFLKLRGICDLIDCWADNIEPK